MSSASEGANVVSCSQECMRLQITYTCTFIILYDICCEQSLPTNTSRCSDQSGMSSIPAQCTAEAYTGESCKEQLAASQICVLGVERPIMINGSGVQERLEKNLISIFLPVLGELDDEIQHKIINVLFRTSSTTHL